MERIVVAYDGTEAAEGALQRAVELAEVFRSRMIVATVDMPYSPAELSALEAEGGFGLPVVAVPSPEDVDLSSHRDRQLEAARALAASHGVACEVVHTTGQPADEIVRVADEHDAQLIVIGPRETGFVTRILTGSVSAGVVRRAHCDVLVVRSHHA